MLQRSILCRGAFCGSTVLPRSADIQVKERIVQHHQAHSDTPLSTAYPNELLTCVVLVKECLHCGAHLSPYVELIGEFGVSFVESLGR